MPFAPQDAVDWAAAFLAAQASTVAGGTPPVLNGGVARTPVEPVAVTVPGPGTPIPAGPMSGVDTAMPAPASPTGTPIDFTRAAVVAPRARARGWPRLAGIGLIIVLLLGVGVSALANRAAGPALPGDTLVSDDFRSTDKTDIVLPVAERATYQTALRDGELVIVRDGTPSVVQATVYLRRSFAAATLAVEARLVGGADSRYLAIGCHTDDTGGYQLTVDPARPGCLPSAGVRRAGCCR